MAHDEEEFEYETPSKPDQETQEAIRAGMVDAGAKGGPEEVRDEGDEMGEAGTESRFEEDGDGTEDERNSMHVDSAFVVFFQDGEAFGVGSLGTVSMKVEGNEIFLEPEKLADTAMMWRGCTEVAKDILVHEQAAKTVEALQAHTLQMHQALQQAQPGGGRLHVPGQ